MMQSSESWERVCEGLNRAASCCRELGAMTKINAWFNLSRQLLIMRQKAKVMYEGEALTELQVQALVTNMEIAQIAAAQMSGNG